MTMLTAAWAEDLDAPQSPELEQAWKDAVAGGPTPFVASFARAPDGAIESVIVAPSDPTNNAEIWVLLPHRDAGGQLDTVEIRPLGSDHG